MHPTPLSTRPVFSAAVRVSAAFVLMVVVAGCQGRPEPLQPGPDPEPAPDPEPDAAVVPCDEEDECAFLGPGAMCMGNLCMAMDPAPFVEQPPPSVQDLTLPVLIDKDPDPGVFEADLVIEAADVQILPTGTTRAFVYRDAAGPARIPGPLIDVEEGTLVRIHVQNKLEEPSSIHWHGLVLPNEMDGVPDMPVAPIEAGASYTYEFVARHPALYWYHPHVRSDVQVERGLHGAFLIRPAGSPAGEVPVTTERVLVLDDILVDPATGEVEAKEEGPAHYTDENGEMRMTFASMMGRQGNRLLVNGRMNPILDVKKGSVERWRLVNTANARFFRIHLEGHTLVQIGNDGGLIPVPASQEDIVLAPSQRLDILVAMDGEPGSEHALLTLHYDRGHDLHDPGPLPLALVRYGVEVLDPPAPIPSTTALIEPLTESAEPHHRVVLGETMVRGAQVGFMINEELWPNGTMLSGRLDRTETWEIVNDTHMDHPFHLHGTRFQVTSRGPEGGPLVAVPPGERTWEDSVLVVGEETVRIAARFEDFPGMWMFHCHIFEHAELGMMGRIEVEP